ncbi:MAG: hypothetical protein ABI388_00380 [Bacteroidia bacterium]
MKKITLIAFILLMPFLNQVLFSQVKDDDLFYIYKTGKDFANDNKILYGKWLKWYHCTGISKAVKLDSAGKQIKVDLKKLNFFGYEINKSKNIDNNCGVAATYLGGNKYVFMVSSNPSPTSYDEEGYASNVNIFAHLAPCWGIFPSFYKIDKDGNFVEVYGPKRDQLFKYEVSSEIEGLLQEYPTLYKKYLSEVEAKTKQKDPGYYFSWLMDYFKTYADMLKADMEKKVR